MLKRKVTDQLAEWKENYAGQYAVLLEGARRVGKSTIVKDFVRRHYKSYIIIDFSHIKQDVLECFDCLGDLDFFFLRLQAVTYTTLYERQSAIVFDEIQLMPKARQAIKHLVADGRYDYIETGSLISIKKNVKDIVIPSEEIKIPVYPLDYEEFCWATGRDYSVFEKVLKANRPLGQAANRSLMRDFRVYMAVGGMPQAVVAYTEGKNFRAIDTIKRQIIDLYKDDFRKIDSSGRISMIFDSIPSQLALSHNRFVISRATKKRRTDKDYERLYDLLDSKTVLICYDVTEPSVALDLTKDLDKFKLYLADTGLFVTMLFRNKKLVSEDIYKKLLSDSLEANLGYLYENAIAQIIASNNRELYYHCWQRKDSPQSFEVDFLVSDGNKIIPIEVKSSEVKNHRSIKEFAKKYSSSVSRSILFSQKDLGHDGMLELKPLYLAPSLLGQID